MANCTSCWFYLYFRWLITPLFSAPLLSLKLYSCPPQYIIHDSLGPVWTVFFGLTPRGIISIACPWTRHRSSKSNPGPRVASAWVHGCYSPLVSVKNLIVDLTTLLSHSVFCSRFQLPNAAYSLISFYFLHSRFSDAPFHMHHYHSYSPLFFRPFLFSQPPSFTLQL